MSAPLRDVFAGFGIFAFAMLLWKISTTDARWTEVETSLGCEAVLEDHFPCGTHEGSFMGSYQYGRHRQCTYRYHEGLWRLTPDPRNDTTWRESFERLRSWVLRELSP